MTEITAAMVKELREKSGAGMMDCKKALAENNGDMEAAIDWLRAKGIAKADKKSGRTAAEGLIGIASTGTTAVVVEVNSETDFVARNDAFQDLVRGIAQVALSTDGSVDAVSAATYPASGKSVTDTIKDSIATIGENMSLRRSALLSVDDGVVATYVHNAVADNLGKLGVLVALKSTGNKDALAVIGRQVAMHIAATAPLAIRADEVDAAVAERERNVFIEQSRESGKPENIIEKMVEGRMRKFFEEVALLSQAFVINPDLTVGAAVKEAEKEVGAPIEVTGMVRLLLGEGVEKEESDFAAEVAAAAKG
ncbi:MAG: translation elongation factor Ts [Alphaproteobacteria bacterium]|jgi:elongation factor Ts|uniref:translation elongation factor Ts n=1 Tax=Pseudorhizobium pelagicum TaxID=1509405 RepID=UPI00182132C1|nr:elongation factor Ts [Hyphomicrobiales bacterium]MBU1314946.1 translation elongation factor Ts [Alphaproteobacteria bacterium]MDY6961944.1 translation elongation factor Ts [Pseudomonadota bacterium]MBU1550028.1 translation elongation factor Ts [Alphaproteobacteria bacterium]MBU2337170.1 translation elongation factor Ts [Alphaproteobacteria bacterium]|tara:strand:+ start:433 stop:1359 length:927 start_codon:yes stop_codon:yes gene_type:complete